MQTDQGTSFDTDTIVRQSFAGELLSRERELELARRWRDNGDRGALEALVRAYMRLVARTAAQYARYGLNRDDLIQEGAVGLLQAAERFDPERGFRFGTFASWWVRAAIQRYLLDNWSIVRFATTHERKRLFFGLRSLKNRIERMSGPVGESDFASQAARAMSVDTPVVETLLPMLSGRDASLDAPVSDEGEGSLVDLLEDPSDDVERVATVANTAAARSRWLKHALGDLPERDAYVVRRRFLGERKDRLSEIALDLGLSKERVRQIEARALQSLRAYLDVNFPGEAADILLD